MRVINIFVPWPLQFQKEKNKQRLIKNPHLMKTLVVRSCFFINLYRKNWLPEVFVNTFLSLSPVPLFIILKKLCVIVLTVTSKDVCCSKRNVKFILYFLKPYFFCYLFCMFKWVPLGIFSNFYACLAVIVLFHNYTYFFFLNSALLFILKLFYCIS